MLSKKRLFLAADGETIVEQNDPRASRLIVGAGCEIDEDRLKEMGLSERKLKDAIKAMEEGEAGPADEDADTKGLSIPPATKAIVEPEATKSTVTLGAKDDGKAKK